MYINENILEHRICKLLLYDRWNKKVALIPSLNVTCCRIHVIVRQVKKRESFSQLSAPVGQRNPRAVCVAVSVFWHQGGRPNWKNQIKNLNTQDQWRNLILKIHSCSTSFSYWCESNETKSHFLRSKTKTLHSLVIFAFLQNDKQVILPHQNTSLRNSSTSWVKIFLS